MASLPTFGRMCLAVHLNRDHPQVVYRQTIFMLSRSMPGKVLKLSVFNRHKWPAAFTANQS